MRSKPACLTALIIAISFSAYCQADSAFLNRAVSLLEKQATNRPQEKVYLQMDRPHYNTGDTIWFKAYTVIGEKHQLSALSGVLYTELISPKDSVIKRLTLPLISGTAWGNFIIPRSYKPGSYRVRAYTNWMRNAGPDYFYNQKIQIGGMQIPFASPKQAITVNPDVQFFPEGGGLVNGVRSKVAVKAINTNGLGEDIKGVIEDSEGNVVADFATQHLGMGVFAFTPQSGKTYRAKISGPGETGFTVSVPTAIEEGYTLALDNRQKDSIYIKVAVNEKLFKEKMHSRFYLVAQSGGKIYYTAAGRLESPVFTSAIESRRFPTGIVQFTLFSQSGEPMAERIAFIQNNDTLKLDIKSNLTVYTTRQPVKISLDALDNTNKPITGSFSVAVINESRVGVDENAESTIVNNLLLTSELTGNIEQPNYYFTNSSEQTAADLDVLMLTQGCHRFEWKQVLTNAAPMIAFRPEKSLELAGTLKTPSGKPVPNGKITLVSTKENILRDTITDINGNFKFDNLYLSDTSKIVLRARKAHNGSNVAIYVRQPDFPGVVRQKEQATGLSPEIEAILQKNDSEYRLQMDDSIKNGRRLKEVVVKDKRQAKPDAFNRYGTMEERYIDMKTLRGFPSLENAIDGTQSTLLLPFKGNRAAIDNIKVIIDGLPFHKKDLYAYDPNEIESVAVISGILPTDPPLLVITTKRYAGTDRTVLKQVKIKSTRLQKAPDLSMSSNLHGGGNADQVIMGDQLGSCISLADCLTGKIKYNHSIKGMSVIIDGIVMEPNYIKDVNPNDIYSVEFLWSGHARSIYGSSIRKEGALVITMKRGGEANKYKYYAAADTTVLKQVNINGKKIVKPDLSLSSNLRGGGNADQVIMGDELGNGCINISDCLIGKIKGVIFGKDGTPINTRGGEMTIVVDGNVLEGSHLDELVASDIYSIEVLRSGASRAIYGTSINPSRPGKKAGGTLIITMKHGGEANKYKYNAAADTTVLKQVNIKARQLPKKPELRFSSNLNGPGKADQIIMGKEVEGCVTLSDCLQGRVTGVVFTHPNSWGERKPYLMRAMGRLDAAPYMVIIVDGIIMGGEHLDEINTKDIASIEVLRSGAYLAIYGSNAPGGAFVITTKRGGEDTFVTSVSPAGLITYPFQGFYKARTFYSPKYTASKSRVQAPDMRNTIYWNPNVITGKDGKASFDYFNNDTKGSYRMVVEGIDDNGNLGRAVYRYRVE